MANSGFQLQGVQQSITAINNCIRNADRETKRQLLDIGNDLLSKAVQLAPIDKGDLRGSGKCEQASDGSVSVTFNTPYALRQHEEMGYNHPNGGQAKYLEQPYNQNIGRYVASLGRAVGGAL